MKEVFWTRHTVSVETASDWGTSWTVVDVEMTKLVFKF